MGDYGALRLGAGRGDRRLLLPDAGRRGTRNAGLRHPPRHSRRRQRERPERASPRGPGVAGGAAPAVGRPRDRTSSRRSPPDTAQGAATGRGDSLLPAAASGAARRPAATAIRGSAGHPVSGPTSANGSLTARARVAAHGLPPPRLPQPHDAQTGAQQQRGGERQRGYRRLDGQVPSVLLWVDAIPEPSQLIRYRAGQVVVLETQRFKGSAGRRVRAGSRPSGRSC